LALGARTVVVATVAGVAALKACPLNSAAVARVLKLSPACKKKRMQFQVYLPCPNEAEL